MRLKNVINLTGQKCLFTNKTNRRNITEISLAVVFNPNTSNHNTI